MSLIEVMLATVMLLGCVMALSRVAFIARKHANGAEDRSMSQIHCQNIMEEMLAGMRPLSSVPPEAFEGGVWVYMVDVQPLETVGLAKVSVTVDRLDDEEGALPAEDELNGYRLVRWIRGDDVALDPLGGEASDGFESLDDPSLDEIMGGMTGEDQMMQEPPQ